MSLREGGYWAMASACMAQSWALWQHVMARILKSFLGKLQRLVVVQQILHGDTLGDQIPGMLA
jgi:hypothetical protein